MLIFLGQWKYLLMMPFSYRCQERSNPGTQRIIHVSSQNALLNLPILPGIYLLPSQSVPTEIVSRVFFRGDAVTERTKFLTYARSELVIDVVGSSHSPILIYYAVER